MMGSWQDSPDAAIKDAASELEELIADRIAVEEHQFEASR